VTPDDAYAAVRDALAVILERAPDEIRRTSSFEQLRVDSLVLVELADILESEIPGLRIDDASLCRLGSVDDAVDLVSAGHGH
jgi:acyl carrier protein